MLIIDRFEGDFAVAETDKGVVNIPRSDIPATAKEGDVLVISISESATGERKKEIDDMMGRLFKKADV
ncbi:MAG: DUF3006 domain-containing protein [Oscillospiraceae bacterium]|nr:DUF3006 domain-containing protein [Oscillospiraceae bacterium]